MTSEAFFHTSCPSCGAPVDVHSATAVTVVCSYCNSMLVRQDDSLHDTGRDSALLTDFSPLQIGTMGRFAGQGFAVIGRLQVRYDDGVWNEWYVRYDDGSSGWLSEAGDIHVMVREVAPPSPFPTFAEIHAGQTTVDMGRRFVASDVREIVLENAMAQGELPFALPARFENRVADFRCENAFLTLDYATATPTAFLGKTVKLAELALQNLKDDAQIRQEAGRLKGSRLAQNCPNCASPVQWLSGVTNTVICPSCHSDLNMSEGKAKLREADAMRKAQETSFTLPIGRKGKIRGVAYTVIGVVRKEELEGSDALELMRGHAISATPQGWWVEYLLYSTQKGFLWLVETQDGEWSVSETLTDFPRLNEHNEAQGFKKLYDYGGRVSFAKGAFYWHIRAGDVNYYTDYRQGNGKLCAELSPNELAWSKSVPMTDEELTAFGIEAQAQSDDDYDDEGRSLAEEVTGKLRTLMVVAFTIINLPAWLMMGSDDLFGSLFISGFVVWFLVTAGRDDDDDD